MATLYGLKDYIFVVEVASQFGQRLFKNLLLNTFNIITKRQHVKTSMVFHIMVDHAAILTPPFIFG